MQHISNAKISTTDELIDALDFGIVIVIDESFKGTRFSYITRNNDLLSHYGSKSTLMKQMRNYDNSCDFSVYDLIDEAVYRFSPNVTDVACYKLADVRPLESEPSGFTAGEDYPSLTELKFKDTCLEEGSPFKCTKNDGEKAIFEVTLECGAVQEIQIDYDGSLTIGETTKQLFEEPVGKTYGSLSGGLCMSEKQGISFIPAHFAEAFDKSDFTGKFIIPAMAFTDEGKVVSYAPIKLED